MKGSYINVTAADGGQFRAYLSVPEGGKGAGGIVLCQEIFGVNAHIRAVADLYAEKGYVVIAPDLFWRMEPGVDLSYDDADFAKALSFYQIVDISQAVADITATVAALRDRPEHSGKVGALGFCLGGKLAYLAAARSGIECAVSYYGVGIEALLDEAAAIHCPMLFHFAAEDSLVPLAAVESIQKAFQKRDDVEIYVYPGVDHAFSTVGRPSFHKPSALMAHQRSIDLFRRVMSPDFEI